MPHLLGEEGRGFYQDFPLFAQLTHLTAQQAHLLQFLGGQTIMATAFVDIGLPHPQAQRFRTDFQPPCDLGGGLATLPDQAHRLSTELWWIRAMTLRHLDTSSYG